MTAARLSAGNPGHGVVTMRLRTMNQHNRPALEMSVTVLVQSRAGITDRPGGRTGNRSRGAADVEAGGATGGPVPTAHPAAGRAAPGPRLGAGPGLLPRSNGELLAIGPHPVVGQVDARQGGSLCR